MDGQPSVMNKDCLEQLRLRSIDHPSRFLPQIYAAFNTQAQPLAIEGCRRRQPTSAKETSNSARAAPPRWSSCRMQVAHAGQHLPWARPQYIQQCKSAQDAAAGALALPRRPHPRPRWHLPLNDSGLLVAPPQRARTRLLH